MRGIPVSRSRINRSSRRCFTADDLLSLREEEFNRIQDEIRVILLQKNPISREEITIFESPLASFGGLEFSITDLDCPELELYIRDAIRFYPSLDSYLRFVLSACEVELEKYFDGVRCF